MTKIAKCPSVSWRYPSFDMMATITYSLSVGMSLWTQEWDSQSGSSYYYNSVTKERCRDEPMYLRSMRGLQDRDGQVAGTNGKQQQRGKPKATKGLAPWVQEPKAVPVKTNCWARPEELGRGQATKAEDSLSQSGVDSLGVQAQGWWEEAWDTTPELVEEAEDTWELAPLRARGQRKAQGRAAELEAQLGRVSLGAIGSPRGGPAATAPPQDMPTSSISLVSHLHGRSRRGQRGISKRELQEAVKYGVKEYDNGREGQVRWRYTTPYNGVVYITDESSRQEITSWRTDIGTWTWEERGGCSSSADCSSGVASSSDAGITAAGGSGCSGSSAASGSGCSSSRATGGIGAPQGSSPCHSTPYGPAVGAGAGGPQRQHGGAERVTYQCCEVLTDAEGMVGLRVGPRLVAKETRCEPRFRVK